MAAYVLHSHMNMRLDSQKKKKTRLSLWWFIITATTSCWQNAITQSYKTSNGNKFEDCMQDQLNHKSIKSEQLNEKHRCHACAGNKSIPSLGIYRKWKQEITHKGAAQYAVGESCYLEFLFVLKLLRCVHNMKDRRWLGGMIMISNE